MKKNISQKKEDINEANFEEVEQEENEMKKNEVLVDSKWNRVKRAWKKMPIGKKVKVAAVSTLGLVAGGAIILGVLACLPDENETDENEE